ncbi:MAG: RND family transporter [Bacteroidales bacterium]|nr:RND family transporter [Bacteroidales bacterium]
MNKLAEGIIKLRWLIIIAVLGLTVFFGYQLKDIEIDADVINSLPDDDTTAVLYTDIGNKYGGNTMGMVIIQADNIFDTKVLEDIKQVTDTVKYIDGISTVTSLTNVIDIKGSDWGIEIGKLVDEYDLPSTKAQLDSLKHYVMSKEMYKGNIVSEDGTSTLVLFTLLDDADKQAVAKEVKEKITKLNLPEKISFGGIPMMMDDISTLLLVDMRNLIPITFIVIMLVLLISFRSARGVILPLLTASISTVWVLGIMQLSGYMLNLVSINMPVVLLAVGSAYTIHVINRVNECKEKDRRKALIIALTYIIIPVLLSGITTAFGFISFIFGAYLTMIRDFGMFTSLGVLIALLISVVFVPAFVSAFSMFKSQKALKGRMKSEDTIMGKMLLTPFSNLIVKHPKYITVIWVVVMAISIWGIFNIKTSVNFIEYLQKDDPTRITEGIIQKKFGGSIPVFVVFKGDMQSPDVLKTMIKTGDYMKEYPEIASTQSVADLIEEMNDVMREGKKIPDEQAKIEQLWFLLDGQDIMSQLVTDDLDEGIIQSKFASAKSEDAEEFVVYMNKYIKENSTDDCQIILTGMPSVYVKLNDSLINSQLSSLLIAILMVVLIVALILRSFPKGVYAAIPIVATIIILFGFMGVTGIALDIATVLVASIALGMGIDYSIHIITHFSKKFDEVKNINEAIKDSIMISGKAIIINVISVALGFLVLTFSHIVPIQNFGLLVALSMFGAGVGALTLLPVILILANRAKEQMYKSLNNNSKYIKNIKILKNYKKK